MILMEYIPFFTLLRTSKQSVRGLNLCSPGGILRRQCRCECLPCRKRKLLLLVVVIITVVVIQIIITIIITTEIVAVRMVIVVINHGNNGKAVLWFAA